MSKQRKQGDPCLCTAQDHGHDDRLRCEKPVYGLTRGGNVKKICDDCRAHSAARKNPAMGPLPPDEPDEQLELERIARQPVPPPQPQECPACGHMVQPAYIVAHAQGRDVNHPECPLFRFDTDSTPAGRREAPDDVLRMKF